MKNWTRDVIAGGALVVLLGGGGLWAANAGIIGGPAQESPAVIQEEVTPSPTPSVTPTPVPVVEPIEEAPVVAPPVVEPPYYGEPVPWIADSNPNSTEGGYWDTTQCPTSSAHQGPDGNQYCD